MAKEPGGPECGYLSKTAFVTFVRSREVALEKVFRTLDRGKPGGGVACLQRWASLQLAVGLAVGCTPAVEVD